jgi:hypothetical protein
MPTRKTAFTLENPSSHFTKVKTFFQFIFYQLYKKGQMEAQKFTQFEIPNGLVGLKRNVLLDFGIDLLSRQDFVK